HGQINACGGGLEGCWFYRHFPEKGKKVLIIPYQHDKIPMIGELFHHSRWEYAEWLTGDSLLSTICRNSETSNYKKRDVLRTNF
ncbi:MAG: hypothetical protein PVH61_43535, partial [Candidatus Aminicenantes bacterium]